MSENTSSENTIESLIYKAPTLIIAEKIRHDLIMNFTGCWFFLYKNSFELCVTNEYGGKINADVLKTLQEKAAAYILDAKE